MVEGIDTFKYNVWSNLNIGCHFRSLVGRMVTPYNDVTIFLIKCASHFLILG